jgi:cellulose synthase/poly-beta-1,6-N-acetylglucosamine synthase-like glycosyltransferase
MQNDLVASSSASILVFTDADCVLHRDALRCIAETFTDRKVGLVSAQPSYLNAGATEITRNESLYLRYESWLRREESSRGLLAMASGSLFAMRRLLWEPLDPAVGDDFVLPLRTVLRGYRNVLLPEAFVATRLTQEDVDSMLRMKIRIISKDLRGLFQHWRVLNPLRMGSVAVGLWSHKLLRWLVPYFLLSMLVSNTFLVLRQPFAIFMVLQVTFYGVALAGLTWKEMRIRFPLSVASSFCLVNVAAFLGTLHCALGRTTGRWTTVR